MSLKSDTLKSAKWTTIYSVFNILINPLSLFFLTQLFSPVEFGQMAILTIIIGFSKEMAAMGFSQAIIQEDELEKEDLDSIFWFQLGLGILIAITIFISAEQISLFFNEYDMINLIRYSSLIFLFEPFDLVFRSILKKKMKFGLLVKGRIIRLLCNKVIMIYLAYLGFGVVSFIYGNLIGIAILSLIMIIVFIKNKIWFPSFNFSFTRLKPYLKFGMYITGKSIFNNLFKYVDEIIIGNLLGTEALGIYHFANKIFVYLVRLINKPIAEIALPLLSKLKSNKEQFNRTYLKVIKLVGAIGVPAHIGIAITSSLFIPLFFGEKWSGAIVLVAILSFWSMFKILYSGIISSAVYSFGNSNFIFYATLIDLPIRSLILYIGGMFNIKVMGGLLGIVTLIKLIGYQYLLSILSGLKVKEVFINLRYILLSSLIMGGISLIMKKYLAVILSPMILLGLIILSGVVIYGGLIYYLDRDFVNYVFKLAKDERS